MTGDEERVLWEAVNASQGWGVPYPEPGRALTPAEVEMFNILRVHVELAAAAGRIAVEIGLDDDPDVEIRQPPRWGDDGIGWDCR